MKWEKLAMNVCFCWVAVAALLWSIDIMFFIAGFALPRIFTALPLACIACLIISLFIVLISYRVKEREWPDVL